MKANSKVAPMITPVLTSPNTIPTNKPVTIGLESNEVPKAYSDCAIKAMQPKRIACPIICISPFYKTFNAATFLSFGTCRISTSQPFATNSLTIFSSSGVILIALEMFRVFSLTFIPPKLISFISG